MAGLVRGARPIFGELMRRYLIALFVVLLASCEVTVTKKPAVTVEEKATEPVAAVSPPSADSPTVYRVRIRHATDEPGVGGYGLAGDYVVETKPTSDQDALARLLPSDQGLLLAEKLRRELLKPISAPADTSIKELEPEMITKSYGTADARLVRVHDGDTVIVDVPLWPAIIGESISVRLNGYDAPELTSVKHADLAKKAVERMTELTATQRLRLVNLRRDKYFRLNAGIQCEGIDIAAKLVAEGLIKPYTGRGPKPWEEAP